jgi:ABC-type multidrug transport system fused ATPase/permease subunit
MAFFDKEDTAELVTRLSTDIAKLQSALTSSLVGAARGSTMSLGAITMLVRGAIHEYM